jgi:hypothetical protein
VIAATKPELPLRAARAERSELQVIVLSGHVHAEKPPASRHIVGEQEALLAPQPHDGKIRLRTGRIDWPSGCSKWTKRDELPRILGGCLLGSRLLWQCDVGVGGSLLAAEPVELLHEGVEPLRVRLTRISIAT